jgi:tetratricopeptide (TPR) repeat protein
VYRLFAGFLGAILAASQLSAQTNPIPESPTNTETSTNDPVAVELDQLMVDDDAAMDEVDGWIRTNREQAANESSESKQELNQRINKRLGGVQQNYQDFINRHPDYGPGHLAYGSFLEDIGKEDLAVGEYETATKVDPKNPAGWNDLGNYYGENGPLTNAFIDYQKAIDLDPSEPVYYQNLATTVYVYRRDAMQFFQISEQQDFDKALALYQKAVQLDPNDFELASDYAETYYGIKPLRTNDALLAWTNALGVAQTDVEREAVYIHLARIKYLVGRYDEASAQLEIVTNSMYDDLKNRIERNIALEEHPPANSVANSVSSTNLSPVSITATNPPLISTNILMTSVVPALTNPPSFSSNDVSALTNVAPTQPISVPLQAINPPVNPTNLLNNLEIAPPTPRSLPSPP